METAGGGSYVMEHCARVT